MRGLILFLCFSICMGITCNTIQQVYNDRECCANSEADTCLRFLDIDQTTIKQHENGTIYAVGGAVSGVTSYNDLTDKPTLFSGSYVDLTNKPTLFDGDYNSLTNKPTMFSGSYNDLSHKPTIPTAFSGNYSDLTDKPTLFDGDYNSLTNKPDLSNVGGSSSGVVKKGQVLEILAGACDGRQVTVASGTYTLPTVTSVLELTAGTTYTDLPQSFSYQPPPNTQQVIYRYKINIAGLDSHGIATFKLYVDNSEVTDFRRSWVSKGPGQDVLMLDYTFDIGTADNVANGKFLTWDVPKTLLIKVREYSTDAHEVKIFSHGYWEGSYMYGTDGFVRPSLEIIAIGEGGAGGGVAVDNSTIKQHANGTIYVANAPSGSSTDVVTKNGQLLESLAGLCDGRQVTVASGTYTFPSVTQKQELTTTYTEVTGSKITYTPPSGTAQVVYSFSAHIGFPSGTSHPLSHYKLFIDNVEQTGFRKTAAATYFEGFVTVRWVIDIGTVSSNDNVNSRFSSWSSAKTIMLKAREYDSVDNHAFLHSTRHFDGVSNLQFVLPVLQLEAIGEGVAGGGSNVAVDNSTIKQHTNGTIYVANAPSTSSTAVVTKEGQVLEELIGVCDGSAVTVESGTYTLTDVTASQPTTTSWATITGSEIDYTPPTGTTHIIYTMNIATTTATIVEHDIQLLVDSSVVTSPPTVGTGISKTYGEFQALQFFIDVDNWSTSKNIKVEVKHIFYEYVSDHYCNTANGRLQVLVYNDNVDNPGTEEEQAARCAQACNDKKTPISGTWTFDALSFHVANGRCYCNNLSPSQCGLSSGYGYKLYKVVPPTTIHATSDHAVVKPILNIRAIGVDISYNTLPDNIHTLAGVLSVQGTKFGLGVSPEASFHIGLSENVDITASRFECDGTGAIIEQSTGVVGNEMSQTDCSALANYQSNLPNVSAVKKYDGLCSTSIKNSPYNYNVVEVDSGSPDLSMTATECLKYAIDNNLGLLNGGVEYEYTSAQPYGCWIHETNVRYNTDTTLSSGVSCGNMLGSYPVRCLQKLNVKELTSGTPPNDINEGECEGYAGLLELDYESVGIRSRQMTEYGSNFIIGSGYTTFSSVTSASECITTCFEGGYGYSSYATNSVKCRCAPEPYSLHAYTYGTGVYEITLQPSGCYKDGSKIWHTSLITTIPCDETKICLSKETAFNNPGTTDQQRIDACRDACTDRSKPLFSGEWNFRSASFWVEPTGGQCFCGADDASTCATTASDYIDLYALNNPPKGCFKDSLGNHYHNTGTDDKYGVCSSTYTCLRNDEGCLVQDTATETKELSLITEKSAWFRKEIVVSSDQRIKTNITHVENALSLLRNIPTRYYNYVDRRRGNHAIGFIAQEVAQVIPEAVKKQKGYIPSHMKRVSCLFYYNTTLRMHCPELDDRKKYKLYVSNPDEGEKAIEMRNHDPIDKVYASVYCFGEEVEDFHVLEKSKLFAIAFSATQELDKMVATLRKEVDELKAIVYS